MISNLKIWGFIVLLVCPAIHMVCAHPGTGIVMDSKGNVYYTDLVQVWKIAPDGRRTLAVRNVHTHELYIDTADNLYGEHEWYEGEVSDKWGNFVWRLSSSGDFEKVIPDVEGFLDNTTLVRDPAGNSYWSDRRTDYSLIFRHSTAGTDELFTPYRFSNIRWMHFSPNDGNLYVADLVSVKKVRSDGNVDVVTENLKEPGPSYAGVADHHYVFGIWTDTASNVYAAVFGAGKVKRISPDGNTSTIYESPEGWSPSGGLTGRDGTLWIMEFSERNETRVRRISPNGTTTLFGG